MARLKAKLDELKQELIVLKHTRKINEDDLKLPEWFELAADYAEVTDSTDKVIVSLKNAILFQRRIVFCITRDDTRDLVRADKNWKKAGFDNNAWSEVLSKLTKSGLVELVKKGAYRTPSIYKVIDKDIRNALQVDETKQLQESIEFSSKFSTDRKADDKTDAVGSSKYEVDSRQEAVAVESNNKNNNQAVLPDRESKKLVSSGTKVNVNPEHKELLEAATKADPSNSFLEGKEESLSKYGSFTVKQVEFLKKIISKVDTKADKPQLSKKDVRAIKAATADEIFRELNKFKAGFNAGAVFNIILDNNITPESELNALAALLGLSVDTPLAESIATAGKAYNENVERKERLRQQEQLKSEILSLQTKDEPSVIAVIGKYQQLSLESIKAAMRDSFVNDLIISQISNTRA